MAPAYTWDSFTLGFTCFKGDKKLCNYYTHSDQGLFRKGETVMEAVPPQGRRLHFTSPEISVDDLRAVLDGLPDPATHPNESGKKPR